MRSRSLRLADFTWVPARLLFSVRCLVGRARLAADFVLAMIGLRLMRKFCEAQGAGDWLPCQTPRPNRSERNGAVAARALGSCRLRSLRVMLRFRLRLWLRDGLLR